MIQALLQLPGPMINARREKKRVSRSGAKSHNMLTSYGSEISTLGMFHSANLGFGQNTMVKSSSNYWFSPQKPVSLCEITDLLTSLPLLQKKKKNQSILYVITLETSHGPPIHCQNAHQRPPAEAQEGHGKHMWDLLVFKAHHKCYRVILITAL